MAIIRHKRSEQPGKVPLPSELLEGEIAVNCADARMFTKKPDGTVVPLGENPPVIDGGSY